MSAPSATDATSDAGDEIGCPAMCQKGCTEKMTAGPLSHATRTIGALAAIIALAMLASGGAADAAISGNSPEKIAQTAGDPEVNSRSPVAQLSPGPGVTGSNGHIDGYRAITIKPHGHKGTFNEAFASKYKTSCGWFTCTIDVTRGGSYAHWLGKTPYNATSMSLTDHVWVGGVSISVQVGSGPGIGISTNQQVVTFSSTAKNTWRITHAFDNVDWSTHVAIWGPYESLTSSAEFGYQTFWNSIN